jgi:hypothetical protein
MTPDERTLLTQFLSDLSKTQGVAKDAEAAQMIDQTVRSNPDAAYVLTQHALMADQALHQAQAQIQQLQEQLQQFQPQPQPTSFFGGGPRSAPPPASPWAQAAQPPPAPQYPQPQYPQPQYAQPQYAQQGGGGLFGGGPLSGQRSGLGSFLQSAGTTAAGVAGGAFLFEGLSNLFGGNHGFGGGGFGGGGFGGGGFGGGPMEENVTINNYGDDDRDYEDPGTSGDIGGDDYS